MCARTHVSLCIDVCKIIRVGVARHTRDRITSVTREGGRDTGIRINRLKLTTYVSESAFRADIQRLRGMIFDVATSIFFRSRDDTIDPNTPAIYYYASGSAKEEKGEGGSRERIRERYAIYCVTLHVIVVVIVVLLLCLLLVVVVVDLFLEFLSGVIATLGQLKTRVPTVGVYVSSKVLIKERVMEVI